MREIKFRAWIAIPPSKNISYLHKNIEKEKSGYMSREFDFTSFDGDYFKPNGCNIMDMITMQYTGLKDKNDKEYCQDDVFVSRAGFKYRVIKQSAAFWGMPIDTEQMAEDYCLTLLCSINVFSEIIGNAHENPELIINEIDYQDNHTCSYMSCISIPRMAYDS